MYHNNDNDISDREIFIKSFMASFIGATLGSLLDNTKFGRWFNTSRVVGWILTKIVQIFIVGAIMCGGIYIYELIKIW